MMVGMVFVMALGLRLTHVAPRSRNQISHDRGLFSSPDIQYPDGAPGTTSLSAEEPCAPPPWTGESETSFASHNRISSSLPSVAGCVGGAGDRCGSRPAGCCPAQE